MKYLVKIIYILFSVLFLIYLLLPNIEFPIQLNNSLQSQEPADIESKARRSYFTNLEREDVVKHYIASFNLFGLVPLRLNYPPEESQLIIRDQTRSTFLEEIVFPLRESVYINGFKPKSAKDAVIIDNKVWVQKITIKYVSSNAWIRLFVGIVVVLIIPALLKLMTLTLVNMFAEMRRIRSIQNA